MDPKTDLFIKLPQGFLIYSSSKRYWIGGHQESGYYLHIERQSADESIPSILAEGDLDMYLASKSPIEQIDDQISGTRVTGSIGKKEVVGYLAKVNFSAKDCYLILTAREKSMRIGKEKSLTIEIGQQIGRK
jgi:hypothetical protein